MNLCTASPIVVVKPLALVFMIWRACSMTLISALTGWLSKTIKSFATFFVLRVPDCDGFETTPFANSNEVHPILRRFWKSSCVSCTEEFERICDKAIYISLSQQTYTLFETWLALLLEFLLPKPSVDCFDMRNSTGGEYNRQFFRSLRKMKIVQTRGMSFFTNFTSIWGGWVPRVPPKFRWDPRDQVGPRPKIRWVPHISSRIHENLGGSQIRSHLKSGFIAWDFCANF